MIYETLRYRLAGEHSLLIELSDEIDLTVNFKMLSLARMLLRSPELGPEGIRAIIDVTPSFSTVLVQYDPTLISIQGLIRFCEYCVPKLDSPHDLELPSRLIEIPVNYNDRWSRECYEQYCKTIKPIESNPEWVAHLNGLASVEELITCHSTPEWWVGAVGFLVGLPTLMPLAPKFRLKAPKYDPPRTWTPKGTIGVAGGFTTIYPVVVPDGYQMIGRTPVPIYDAQAQRSPFGDTPFLFQIGDRVKFRPIDEAEFEAIEREIDEGRYQYQISESQPFRLSQYLNRTQAAIA